MNCKKNIPKMSEFIDLDAIRKEVIQELNDLFGRDLNNLKKLPELQEQLNTDRKHAEEELNCLTSETIAQLRSNINAIDEISQEFEVCSGRAVQYLGTTNNVIRTLEDFVHDIETFEVTTQYIKICKKIESISSELHSAIAGKDEELSVTLYANLCEINLSLKNSPAVHLLTYLTDVIHHWHNYLKDKFSLVFDDLLSQIKWPFVNTNLTSPNPSQEVLQKLQIYIEYLLQIQLPEEVIRPTVTSALQSDFPPPCLPIQLLIKPLKRRFLFHFTGNKQTNRSDRPEWYMTQILTWIRDHERFIQATVQPVINRLAMHHVNARVEFMRGLTQLVVEKLEAELPTLAYDDALFSHCVDEALGMERELRAVYNYPSSQPGCLGPLVHAPILQKWLNMEKKYALEKMDEIISSTDAWTSDTDEVGDSICGQTIVALLSTMTDRYTPLPQPGHRLQFLELQLDILDDFRIRLLQLAHDASADTHRTCQVLNTIQYLLQVIMEWGETIHFINLHFFKHQFSKFNKMESGTLNDEQLLEAEGGTVFDETTSLYSHMRDDLILTLTETIVLDVKARSRAYRHDSWYLMPVVKDTISLSLTTTACPMYQILATRLHELQQLLVPEIFNNVWRKIAHQLDEFLYEELILMNNFNEGGATQINYDFTRNLLPLFAQYTSKPDVYFPKMKDACVLLTLSKSAAILLLDTLKRGEDGGKLALRELGVMKCSPSASVGILKLRTDIKML